MPGTAFAVKIRASEKTSAETAFLKRDFINSSINPPFCTVERRASRKEIFRSHTNIKRMNKIFVTVFPYIIGLRLIKFFHMDGKKLEIFEMPQIFSNFF